MLSLIIHSLAEWDRGRQSGSLWYYRRFVRIQKDSKVPKEGTEEIRDSYKTGAQVEDVPKKGDIQKGNRLSV
jgi:hypothetical protein